MVLNKVVQKIKSDQNSNLYTLAAFLDIKRAFKTVAANSIVTATEYGLEHAIGSI